jgi:hypothetical protein
MSLQPALRAPSLIVAEAGPSPRTLEVRLHAPQANPLEALMWPQKLESLVQKMRVSPLFSDEIKEKLQIWYSRFRDEILPDLTNDQGKTRGSRALCLVRFGVIGSELDKYQGNQAVEDELLIFEEEIDAILPFVLPSGRELKSFVAAFKSGYEREQRLFAMVDRIKEKAIEDIEKLFQEANKTNEDRKTILEAIKQRVIASSSARETVNAAIHQRLTDLAAAVERITGFINDALSEINQTGTQVEIHHLLMKRFQEQGLQMMKKV